MNPYRSPGSCADGSSAEQASTCVSVCELRRPVRCVLLGWAGLTLLFLVSAPFVDAPVVAYIFGGSLYSLFLVVTAVGFALLKWRKAWATYAAAGGICVVVAVSMLIWVPIYFRMPMHVVGMFMHVCRVVTAAILVSLTILALCGWTRFVWQSRKLGHSQRLPSGDLPDAQMTPNKREPSK
jgi:hypothetical protein